MKEKGKERSQFYYTSPAANFASEGLDASQSIPIKPSIHLGGFSAEVAKDRLTLSTIEETQMRIPCALDCNI
jgi:hypothetical protein